MKLMKSNNFYVIKKQDPFEAYWASDEHQHNGSGVGIIIRKPYHKHIMDIKIHQSKLISVTLRIKKHSPLQIIQVYLPSDHKHSQQIQHTLEQWITLAYIQAHNIIIMRDFNAVLNLRTDRLPYRPKHGTRPEILILDFLDQHMLNAIDLEYPDTNRNNNNDSESRTLQTVFTFENSTAKSHIDYIWLTPELHQALASSDNRQIYEISCSNHTLLSIRFH